VPCGVFSVALLKIAGFILGFGTKAMVVGSMMFVIFIAGMLMESISITIIMAPVIKALVRSAPPWPRIGY